MKLVQLILQKKNATVRNGRKTSETVGNSRKHDQAKTCPTRISFKNKHFRATQFFFEGPKVSKGKRLETVGDRTFARQKCSWKMFENYVETCLFCRAKVRSPTVSNRFPLDTFGPSKKNCVARKCLFLKEMWVRQVLAWSCFRLFPTVSFFLKD